MLPDDLYAIIDNGGLPFAAWEDIERALTAQCRTRGASGRQQRWIFRGHEDEEWTFPSSLERAIWAYSWHRDDVPPRPVDAAAIAAWKASVWNLQRLAIQDGLIPNFAEPRRIDAKKLEEGLIRRFQRQCHHYLEDTPGEDDDMEWHALMRHYGAPTRILDWTWSFFVALFFAVERSRGPSAVWALNVDEIEQSLPTAVLQALADDRNAQEKTTFDAVFHQDVTGIANVSPFRLNQRLVIQQGTFLIPRNIGVPFDDNLAEALQHAPVKRPSLLKFRISGTYEARREILQRLQNVNISNATLFPGLDGFAHSLEQLFAFPDVIVRREPPFSRLAIP